jgi:hypothetical protein
VPSDVSSYPVSLSSALLLAYVTFCWALQRILFLFLSLLFLSLCALFRVFISERDCTPLQCFYKGYTQSNRQLPLSRLIHVVDSGNDMLSYQTLERRATQETSIACAGLHNKKSKAFNNEINGL